MIVLDRQTPKEIQMQIAQNVRAVRKRRKISQKALSEKSGVSLGSVKRFETSGESFRATDFAFRRHFWRF